MPSKVIDLIEKKRYNDYATFYFYLKEMFSVVTIKYKKEWI